MKKEDVSGDQASSRYSGKGSRRDSKKMARSVENINTFLIRDKSVAETEIAELAQKETKRI